jgi:hypothetical protein
VLALSTVFFCHYAAVAVDNEVGADGRDDVIGEGRDDDSAHNVCRRERRHAAAAIEVLPLVVSLAAVSLAVAHEALSGCCGCAGTLPLAGLTKRDVLPSSMTQKSTSRRLAAAARLLSTAHAHVARNRWVELCVFAAGAVESLGR